MNNDLYVSISTYKRGKRRARNAGLIMSLVVTSLIYWVIIYFIMQLTF